MTKPKRIPTEQRPVLITRVCQLHAEGASTREMAVDIGFSEYTVRRLLREAGITLDPRPPIIRKGIGHVFDRICPTCDSAIDVVGGLIEKHKAFFGRIGPGAINGTPVQVAEDCPASGQHYKTLVKESTCSA